MKNTIEKVEFENYLYHKNFTEKTIKEHLNNIKYFNHWLVFVKIDNIENLSRNEMREYVEFMRNGNIKTGTINNRLNTLNKYFECLKLYKFAFNNPARNFHIKKDLVKKVVENPIDKKDLEKLFFDYKEYLVIKNSIMSKEKQDLINLKYLVIISLVLFQGLHSGEISRLKVADINVNKGTIYIESNRRNNSRMIDLDNNQIILFFKYLNSLNENQSDLFNINVQVRIFDLMKELKGINPIIRNIQHIRSSVLINWISEFGLRKSQYLIGHKYASTTAEYEVQDTSKLAKMLENTHLFGNLNRFNI